MKQNILEICYLIGSVTFIMGLKMMGNAKTARKGNIVGAVGMTIAILGTIFLHDGEVPAMIYGLIFGAIALGTIIGWMTAKKVQMTKMPELVSMFNGMGGACAALISLIEFNHYYHAEFPKVIMNAAISGQFHPPYGFLIAIFAGLVIGSISFSGSVIAYLKLNGTMDKPVRLPAYNIINLIVLIVTLGFMAFLVYTGGVLPIGGQFVS
jgi:NAD(P) transhydrogenase subunit beta